MGRKGHPRVIGEWWNVMEEKHWGHRMGIVVQCKFPPLILHWSSGHRQARVDGSYPTTNGNPSPALALARQGCKNERLPMTTTVRAKSDAIEALSAFGKARSTIKGTPLSAEELRKTDAFWRASTYAILGMLYLLDNPLLREPLKPEHIKNRLLGHWGSSPGLAFTYIHLMRQIKKYDLDMIYLVGPGHGAPGVLAPVYLEGSYSEIYPDKSEDEEGLKEFFKQFSFPGGIGSHCTPETPGSIHEGGELGYVLAHACGAAFDNPGLIVAAVV